MPSAASATSADAYCPRRVFHGTIVHSKSLTELDCLHNALLAVDEHGIIEFVERDVVEQAAVERILSERGWDNVSVTKLDSTDFLMPGFIDTHTHAPQYVNTAYGQDYELLDWLKYVTFPTERQFSDPVYARRIYESVVQRLIDTGTTTVCYYGTLHLTTKVLAAVCHRKGQRAFVGKCNMDRLSAEDYQEESAEASLRDTRDFMTFVRERCCGISRGASSAALGSALVQPIITPRFAIACSDELLAGLGEILSKDESLLCQTHLSENPSEIEFTKSLFPFVDSYTAVYDHFKLLRHNTVLAHCVHLTSPELELIKERQAGVSHCPNSNFNIRSGTAPIADMLDRGIKVGLGTDVSGGTAIGILSAIRGASTASKILAVQARDGPPSAASPSPMLSANQHPAEHKFTGSHLSLATLFHLATLGGAQVVNLEDRIGTLDVGKEFDALLVQCGGAHSEASGEKVESEEELLAAALEEERPHDKTERAQRRMYGPSMFVDGQADGKVEGIETLLEKFLFSGDDRNIGSVFVRGRVIGGARPLA